MIFALKLYIRYGSRDNLAFYGEEVDAAVIYDIDLFKSAGGGTIVENTSHGLKRRIKLMQQVSHQTGVNVIAGCGRPYAQILILRKKSFMLLIEN